MITEPFVELKSFGTPLKEKHAGLGRVPVLIWVFFPLYFIVL